MRRKTIIVAEGGINHNGRLDLALRLVRAAKEAGADFVKFQLFRTEEFVSKRYAPFQFEVFNRCRLSDEDLRLIKRESAAVGIRLMLTPLDLHSLELARRIGVRHIKIASGDITFLDLIRRATLTGADLFISTGMSQLEEIGRAVETAKQSGEGKIFLLHCVSEYPTPIEKINLLAMKTLEKEFKVPAGLSDHTLGLLVPFAAAALGAAVIEKHFTLSRRFAGPDQKLSLEPKEFKEMVEGIRKIEEALGSGIKKPTKAELSLAKAARRGLYYREGLDAGQKLSEEDLMALRPVSDLAPYQTIDILGRRLKRRISAGMPTKRSNFED